MAITVNVDTTKYNQIFRLIIESVEYVFHLYWNDSTAKRGFSNSGWYLSVYNSTTFNSELGADNQESLILGGRKLVPLQNLLSQSTDPTLPTGLLTVVDLESDKGTSDDTYFVGLDNFGVGKRFQLYYYSKAELVEYQGV